MHHVLLHLQLKLLVGSCQIALQNCRPEICIYKPNKVFLFEALFEAPSQKVANILFWLAWILQYHFYSCWKPSKISCLRWCDTIQMRCCGNSVNATDKQLNHQKLLMSWRTCQAIPITLLSTRLLLQMPTSFGRSFENFHQIPGCFALSAY